MNIVQSDFCFLLLQNCFMEFDGLSFVHGIGKICNFYDIGPIGVMQQC